MSNPNLWLRIEPINNHVWLHVETGSGKHAVVNLTQVLLDRSCKTDASEDAHSVIREAVHEQQNQQQPLIIVP